MAGKIQKYEGKNIVVYFEGSRCIHAARCVSGLPNVFKPNVPGPWVEPDAADVDELAALITTCPSGALHFKRKDNGVDETKPAINNIHRCRWAARYQWRLDNGYATRFFYAGYLMPLRRIEK